MKKNFIYTMFLALAALVFTSCSDSKDSEDQSRITVYAVLEMNGDPLVKLNVGDTFTDPGCKATLGGEDVSSKIVTTSNLDASTPGFYTINYKVVNADGFPATASRTVMVVNANKFASAYLGESQFGSRHYYNAPIFISDKGNGTYLIDDIAGGFYCYGRYPGYEPTYDFHLESVIKLEADNTITLVDQDPTAWYWEEAITITSGTYDPTTGTVTLVLDFSGDPMYVTLTK